MINLRHTRASSKFTDRLAKKEESKKTKKTPHQRLAQRW